MNDYINIMIDWMEKRIKEAFSLDELANYMGYSPYYCSFKFHQLTGISIRRYLLLRRLYLSTNDLLEGKRIIDIAIKYQYSSQEAYSRAFKLVFGLNPKEFQKHPVSIPSFFPPLIYEIEGNRKAMLDFLEIKQPIIDESNVFHLLNGQLMYEEFKTKQLMGNANYAPFNEAMGTNETVATLFDNDFIYIRAKGHEVTENEYISTVITPLKTFFQLNFNTIVLWFGEDMFCQMNLLTILAYLEKVNYKGKIYLNHFREDEFEVNQTVMTLGNYYATYEKVLVRHQKPSAKVNPIMYQAIELYLELQNKNNRVTKWIKNNKQLSEDQLLKRLFTVFTDIGYGDLQYKKLIQQVRSSNINH